MSIKEFDQTTTFNNPDLPSGALSSKQFNTIVECISEGQVEGSATASREGTTCLLYTSPSPRDRYISRMPSSA